MKKLLIFFALLVGISGTFAANRYANSTDVATYAAQGVQLNDLIWDTPFNTASSRGQIYYPSMASTWGSIRSGGTIWIDGTSSTMANLFNIEIGNGGSTWTGISSEANPVRIRPLNNQIKILMNGSSNTARMVLIYDIPHLEINGYLPSHPGMKHNWTGALHNTFGFVISGDATLSTDSFQLMIDGEYSNGSITIRNIEIENGYCALRIMPGNSSLTGLKLYVENCYFHDTLSGEMFYVGQTTGSPFALFDYMHVRNVICARAGTEAIQLQHMLTNAATSYVENFVIYAAATDFIDPFQDFQSGGTQFLVDEGDNIVRNGIIDGWGYAALNIFSSTAGSPAGETAIFDNILCNDGRATGIYTGPTSNGVNWEFRNLYFRAFNDTYDEFSGTTVPNYIISENSSDETAFINIWKDNTKANFFENQSVAGQVIGTTVDNGMDAPGYRVPPFPDRIAEQVTFYAEATATQIIGHPTEDDPVVYQTDDIVARPIVGTGWRFYNCISGHTSSGSTHPEDDPTKWEVIMWDSNGVPSYHDDYNGVGVTYYPWDDFRLTADSEWNIKGMGLTSNERNTNHTTFQWYIADDNTGTNTKELAGERKLTFERHIEDVGKYVRLKSFFKPASGPIVEVWVNDWKLVN